MELSSPTQSKPSVGNINFSPERKMYMKVYTIIDEVNGLDRDIWAALKSDEMKKRFKRIIKLLKELS